MALVVGAIPFYWAVWAVGLYRLDALSMASLGAAASIAALPGWKMILTSGIGREFKGLGEQLRRDRVLLALWGVLAAVAVSSVLQSLAPPNDYDSLMYHLGLPQHDLERGRIADNWERAQYHSFFPALMHHLYRFGMALADGCAAQLIHAAMGVGAAALTASLVSRLGFGGLIPPLAALLFLSIRAVVWEMGTAEVDVASATTATAALTTYLAWRETRRTGLMVLAGLVMGAGICVKLHGGSVMVALAAAMLVDLVRTRSGFWAMVLSAAVALVVFLPHMVWMVSVSGNNPLFPLFNHVMLPGGGRNFTEGLVTQYGIGRGFLDLLITPFTMAVMPMQHYDGMVLGAPYFIALMPLALFARWDKKRVEGHALAVAIVLIVFYVQWFYLQSQQVRFLLSVGPILAAFAAIGVAGMWRVTEGSALLRSGFVAALTVLSLNQAVFVGMYTVLRLPAALGLKSAEDYLSNTPTMDGAFYDSCKFLRSRLKPGDPYISLVAPHSFYCPQLGANVGLMPDEWRLWMKTVEQPAVTPAQFLEEFERTRYRSVLVPIFIGNRRNDTGALNVQPVDLGASRFGALLKPVLAQLKPIQQGRYTAVYDGDEVLRELRAQVTKAK